ncbi:MAG: Na+/H+ antiporter subunit E [Thermodesulfobacteriota bacterium]
MREPAGARAVPRSGAPRPHPRQPRQPNCLGRFAAWAGVYALLWWALADGEPGSWGVGLPAACAAAALTLALAPPRAVPWSLKGAVGFLPFFLWQSLRGGIDVALRAFSPVMPLEPGFVHYRWNLPEGPARVLFANSVSLAPGTLSARVEEEGLTVHVLDLSQPTCVRLAALETRVAGIFGFSSSHGSPSSHRSQGAPAPRDPEAKRREPPLG